MKNLFLLAFVASSVLCFAQNDSAVIPKANDLIADDNVIEAQEKPYLSVNEMPEFPGGEAALMQFISNNVSYPDSAIKYNIEGMVMVQFTVTRTGEVKDLKVVNKKGIGYGCEEEALRVVKKMPKWKPGYLNGKAVPVYFRLPFYFRLH